MLISTVIMAVCFVLIIFEGLSMLNVFRTCKNVRCIVKSSRKVSEREEGFLVNEYWKTEVDFSLGEESRSAVLETAISCSTGQVLNCYYYPKRDLVFRKRDIRRVMRAHSITAFSVGVLFLLLIILFKLTSLGEIIVAHAFEAASVVLGILFVSFGIGFIIYSTFALRRSRESRVTEVKAKVDDIVRKTKSHRETKRYLYYPIYTYTLNDTSHTVQSKLGRETPPSKGATETVLADTEKGGLIEYKDVNTSFILGVCFLLISGLLIYAAAFLK